MRRLIEPFSTNELRVLRLKKVNLNQSRKFILNDVEAAYLTIQLLDSDHEGDTDIEIEYEK